MIIYGIGLGPDEVDLVTVKGKRLLESMAAVYSPGRLSRTVTLNHVPEERIDNLDLPTTHNPDELRHVWKEAVAEVTVRVNSEDMVFVTLDDPNVYSTFGHLRRTLDTLHPEVDLEVVPGVSAITAFTTALGVEIESGTGLVLREAANGAAPTGPNRMALFKVADAPVTHEKLAEADYDVRLSRRPLMEQGEAVVTDDPDEFAERNYYMLAYAEREGIECDVAIAGLGGVESGGSA